VNTLVESIKELKDRWDKKIEEIKKLSMSKNQCYETYNALKLELGMFDFFNKDKERLKVTDMIELITDLQIALNVAYSNYRKEKKTIWTKIFGGPKTFNLFKL
jgi:hypothetical protein